MFGEACALKNVFVNLPNRKEPMLYQCLAVRLRGINEFVAIVDLEQYIWIILF